MIGLAASCILVALRHLGPLSTSSASQSRAVAGGTATADGRAADPAPLDPARSATAAAAAFTEVLGRALDPRFSKHLGRAALTTVMSAVLHCWPPSPSSAGADGGSNGDAAVVSSASEVAGIPDAAGAGQRGYAMGWWRLEPDGRLRRSNSGGGGADEPGLNRGANAGAGTTGEAAQPGPEDVLEDEWGSYTFLDDPELNAILSGGAASQPGAQQQELAAAAAAAEAAAAEASVAAAAAAAAEEERQKTWQSLADGARTHVLPHLHEILKTTYTIARYAQGSSASSASLASSSTSSAARGVPPRPAATAASTAVGASSSSSLAATGRSSSTPAAALLSIESSRVDAGTLLELHAAAALLVLHGCSGGNRTFGVSGRSGSGHGGDGGGGGSRGGGGGSRGGVDGEPGSTYNAVRERYLEVHRMVHSPLLPQQRLLAAAFFCLALGSSGTSNSANGGDDSSGGGGGDQHGSSIDTGLGGGEGRRPCPLRPAPPLLEALRGREWEVLQLWMQAALDPLVFPVSQRRHRLSRGDGGGGGGGGRGANREPSDIVRERFEGFTRCLSDAFGGGDGDGDGGGGGGGAGGGNGSLDADVAGVFEKRLVRFEPAQLAVLSSEEARVRKTGARCCVAGRNFHPVGCLVDLFLL